MAKKESNTIILLAEAIPIAILLSILAWILKLGYDLGYFTRTEKLRNDPNYPTASQLDQLTTILQLNPGDSQTITCPDGPPTVFTVTKAGVPVVLTQIYNLDTQAFELKSFAPPVDATSRPVWLIPQAVAVRDTPSTDIFYVAPCPK